MHEQRHALADHVIRVGVPLLQEVGNRSRRAGVGGVHEGRLAMSGYLRHVPPGYQLRLEPLVHEHKFLEVLSRNH